MILKLPSPPPKLLTVEQQAALIKCQNVEIEKLSKRLKDKLTKSKNNKWR